MLLTYTHVPVSKLCTLLIASVYALYLIMHLPSTRHNSAGFAPIFVSHIFNTIHMYTIYKMRWGIGIIPHLAVSRRTIDVIQ